MDESKIIEGVLNSLLSKIPQVWKALKNKFKKNELLTDEEIKKKTKILFIDDEKFEYIDIIREAGWNVSQINDLDNLDQECVKMSDIIFLDYKGVGNKLSPSEEGIGLLKVLKKKYSDKPIIFYSAHAGFSLGDEFKWADDWLPKNADPYVFIEKIEYFAKK